MNAKRRRQVRQRSWGWEVRDPWLHNEGVRNRKRLTRAYEQYKALRRAHLRLLRSAGLA